MPYEITLARVPPVRLAVFPTRATRQTLGRVITSGPVWTFLRALGIRTAGHNVVVYRSRAGEAAALGEFLLEVGADVFEPFAEAEGVVNATTPAGLSASTRHTGPYSEMGGAHEAILAWCRANGRRLAGPSWEVYGHWTDDPAALETDIFYLVSDEARP